MSWVSRSALRSQPGPAGVDGWRFDATADFTADVQQEMVMISTNRTFTGKGTVAFKRPGRMKWVLKNQEEQIIIADGTTL